MGEIYPQRTQTKTKKQTEVKEMKKDFYVVYTADKEYLFGADTFVECVAYCQEHDINGANNEYIAEGTLDTEYNDFEMSDCYDIPAKKEEKEMKKYTVEFYVEDNQIWDGYDEFYMMDADSAEEAIDLAIDWSIEHDIRYGDVDVDIIRAEYEDMTWRAAELVTDEDGYTDRGEWEVR